MHINIWDFLGSLTKFTTSFALPFILILRKKEPNCGLGLALGLTLLYIYIVQACSRSKGRQPFLTRLLQSAVDPYLCQPFFSPTYPPFLPLNHLPLSFTRDGRPQWCDKIGRCFTSLSSVTSCSLWDIMENSPELARWMPCSKNRQGNKKIIKRTACPSRFWADLGQIW